MVMTSPTRAPTAAPIWRLKNKQANKKIFFRVFSPALRWRVRVLRFEAARRALYGAGCDGVTARKAFFYSTVLFLSLIK